MPKVKIINKFMAVIEMYKILVTKIKKDTKK